MSGVKAIPRAPFSQHAPDPVFTDEPEDIPITTGSAGHGRPAA